jgi:hypothetical protein
MTEPLERIKGWRNTEGINSSRGLSPCKQSKVQTEKSTVEFLETNKMRKAPHSAYSPNLTSSNFDLFGDMERKLNGCMFKSGNELLSVIQTVLDNSKNRLSLLLFWSK